MNLANNKQTVLMLCRETAMKMLDASGSEILKLLSQMDSSKEQLRQDIRAQIGTQLEWIDEVTVRNSMYQMKLELLGSNAPSATTLSNLRPILAEMDSKDDLANLKVSDGLTQWPLSL